MIKLIIVLSVLALASVPSYSQQQQPKPSPEPVDVIRVDTNLVQTTVTVLDKGGKFVEGLRQEDFQLKIEGKPVTIAFFKRITAGSANERAQLAALKNGQKLPATNDSEVRGRTVVFFIDDLHLSASGVHKIRETVTNFITNQMGPNDLVAISSASGQIGFLQQYTDNKSVLAAAIARLYHRPYVVHDTEQIGLTEYSALRIDAGDKDALSYYANEWLKLTKYRSQGGSAGPPSGGPINSTQGAARSQQSGISREIAERQVKERASMMLKQSTAITANTLASFENLVRTATQQNGRKLVFFISDGFYLNDRNTGFGNKLIEIIDRAVRAGIVVYSLDARGLISETDASSNRFDPEGKLSRSNIGQVSASQDAMSALANDTGGRALFNSDQLGNAIDRALQETSEYYLLAWRPEVEEQKTIAFRKLDIIVAGRPDVSVRLPKGYLANVTPSTVAETTPATETKVLPTDKPADADLKRALSAAVSLDTIPITVSASYVDAPGQGAIVNAGVQTLATVLDYGADGKQAAIDVAGVILNDQGKVADSFRTRLTVSAIPTEYTTRDTGVVYNYKAKLAPGLYQIRAAVRDERSAMIGSSTQWIEVPDLTKKNLSLSSLLLRSVKKGDNTNDSNLQFSVDHHFSRSAQLSFLIFIYNASRNSAGAKPDLTAQVQVFRNGASVISTPVRNLSMDNMSDLAHIPYAGQFSLESLPSGRYEIQITIADRLAKTSASQRIKFQID